jgi:hypothetical protein
LSSEILVSLFFFLVADSLSIFVFGLAALHSQQGGSHAQEGHSVGQTLTLPTRYFAGVFPYIKLLKGPDYINILIF